MGPLNTLGGNVTETEITQAGVMTPDKTGYQIKKKKKQ